MGWKHWTKEEENLLKKEYPKSNRNIELAKQLGRTVQAVNAKAGKLGLKRPGLYPSKYPNGNLDAVRKYKYGLTPNDYNMLFKKQGGCCAICEKHQSELNVTLCVDHNHKTNKIRGLLCKKCNSLLGFSSDSIEILNKVIDYLRK